MAEEEAGGAAGGEAAAPTGGEATSAGGYDYRKVHNYPLIKFSDMNEEMRVEAMELCVTACEKHASSNEAAAKMIKETMDKKFGASWHAVVGEGYGFEVTHEVKNMMYMFFGGTMAICLWKCA
ncbi:PREDICTED: dynein light chain 4, axonemal-like [Amphimedon queenslandica]|uniref:Dynein light chain n=1 Tax=Amphimedon queenslandica TaxID=400682 RepID=A0AAN0IEF8_AMPQE|nr:PREDICTED: dynein light chain 4, axonemal-like [Amphimedon queenslandica]|eukprot:XP_003386873.1 PREDICTED: dynein light chain 4, axonemal-like [Amphimedon queenslandica]